MLNFALNVKWSVIVVIFFEYFFVSDYNNFVFDLKELIRKHFNGIHNLKQFLPLLDVVRHPKTLQNERCDIFVTFSTKMHFE